MGCAALNGLVLLLALAKGDLVSWLDMLTEFCYPLACGAKPNGGSVGGAFCVSFVDFNVLNGDEDWAYCARFEVLFALLKGDLIAEA